MKKVIINPVIKLRRWNKVLLDKCVHLHDTSTAEWFQNQIPQDSPPPLNIRAFARLYWLERSKTEYGYEMAELMDGSGECGKFIYAHYNDELIYDVNKTAMALNVSLKEVEVEIMSIIETIHKIRKLYLPYNPPFALYDELQNWSSLLGCVEENQLEEIES